MIEPLMPAIEFFLSIYNLVPISFRNFISLICALFGIALFWNIIYHIRS